MGTSNDRLHLLDTNIVIYIQKGVPSVMKHLAQTGRRKVAIPDMVLAELAYGVEKSQHKARNLARLQALMAEVPLRAWPREAAWHYGKHWHLLKSAGTPIGQMDLLIAAHALAEDAILVTNNTREFERIEGLKLENWAQ